MNYQISDSERSLGSHFPNHFSFSCAAFAFAFAADLAPIALRHRPCTMVPDNYQTCLEETVNQTTTIYELRS
jgi:hypothetical protein